jgi:hypothetical protein
MSMKHAKHQTPAAMSDTYIAIDCSILLLKPMPRHRDHPTAVHQGSGILLKAF